MDPIAQLMWGFQDVELYGLMIVAGQEHVDGRGLMMVPGR